MSMYRSSYAADFGLFAAPLTPAVRTLLAVNVVVFLVRTLVQWRVPGGFDLLFGLSEALYRDAFVWQLFTYMFLHGTVWHLLFNMLILYFLGSEIERALGSRDFLMIFVISGLLGGLGWLLLAAPGSVCIGASGAVFGLLGAYVALFPQRYITVLVFFILPVTMRAWVLAVVLGSIEFLLMTSAPGGQIAHSAHLAGLVAGYVFAYMLYRGVGPRWRLPRIRVLRNKTAGAQPHLTVLRNEPAAMADSEEIDRILDKIAQQGMSSLTKKERAVLEKASAARRGT